jgi:CrcB protein
VTRTPLSLELLALVGIGGFAGSNLRYLVALQLPGLAGTLLVNTLGSAALALLLYAGRDTDAVGRRTRLVLGTGVLPSFTTYSTFAVETARVALPTAVGYVLATHALGFGAVVVGQTAVTRLAGGAS